MIEEILKKYPKSKDYLLEILHDIQKSHPQQFIPTDYVGIIARHLNITQSQVYGVIGYYSMLSLEPRGKYLIRVCRSPICNMINSESLVELLERKLCISIGETTADAKYTLEECECLGNCASAPSLMVNDKLYGNLTVESLSSLIDNLP